MGALRRAERDQSCAFGLKCGQALFTHEPDADPHVKMQPFLDDLAKNRPKVHPGKHRPGGRGPQRAKPGADLHRAIHTGASVLDPDRRICLFYLAWEWRLGYGH